MGIIQRLFHCLFGKPTIDVDYLNHITYEQTKPFVPTITYCKVIKVYDGDTITVAARLPGDTVIYRFSVRLAGIDSPEIKSKNPREHERAVFVRDRLHELVYSKIVLLHNVSIEKYGRILADVYLDNLYINQHMIDQKYARSYDGRTKPCFIDNVV